jgi:hypothetical protein
MDELQRDRIRCEARLDQSDEKLIELMAKPENGLPLMKLMSALKRTPRRLLDASNEQRALIVSLAGVSLQRIVAKVVERKLGWAADDEG